MQAASLRRSVWPLVVLGALLLNQCHATQLSVNARSTMAYAQTTDVFLSAYGFPDTPGQPVIDLYFQAFDLWTTVSPPAPTDRWYASAAAVESMKIFVIAGGYSTPPVTFDTTLTLVNYSGVVDSASAQSQPTATSILNPSPGFIYGCMGSVWDEVYWAGGELEAGGPSSSLTVFDPVGRTLRSTPPLSVARSRLSCLTYFDGTGSTILIAGGRTNAGTVTAQIDGWAVPQNPASPGIWPQMPAISLFEARESMAAANVNNYVIFAGGYTGTGYSQTVDVIQLGSNPIQGTTMLSVARSGMAVAIVPSPPQILFIGGYDGTTVYNITDVMDTSMSNPNFLSSIYNFTVPRWLSSAVGFSGKAFLVGGQKDTIEQSIGGLTGSIDKWDPLLLSWTAPDAPSPTSSAGPSPSPTSTPTPPPGPSPSPPPPPGPVGPNPSTSGGTTPPPPTTTTPVCVGSAPAPGAVCVLGVWTINGDVDLPGSIIVPSPVVINGALILRKHFSYQLGNATFVGAEVTEIIAGVPLVINGEASVSGVLVLTLPTVPINGQLIPVLQAGSINGSFSNVTVVKDYADADCDSVSGSQRSTPTTISVLMSVSQQDCGKSKGLSTGAIVGIAVGGAFALVILIVVMMAIALACDCAWARKLLRGKRRTKNRHSLAVYDR